MKLLAKKLGKKPWKNAGIIGLVVGAVVFIIGTSIDYNSYQYSTADIISNIGILIFLLGLVALIVYLKRKRTKGLSKKGTVVLSCIIALLFAIFLSRGWLRSTVIPDSASVVYIPSIDKQYNSAYQNIKPVTNILGIQSLPTKIIQGTSIPSGCSLDSAYLVYISVVCTSKLVHSWTILTPDELTKITNNATVANQELIKSGWSSQYSVALKASDFTPNNINTFDSTYSRGNCTLEFTYNRITLPNTPSELDTQLFCERGIGSYRTE